MKGKEHMIIGTTVTATMGVGLLIGNISSNFMDISLLIFGGIVGSYMPDIDSKKSKAGQIFNKVMTTLIIIIIIGYLFGLSEEAKVIINAINSNMKGNINIVFFIIMIILGKISPHRMFTHKILGTILFCLSIYFLGYEYFTIGFITGYILHVLCDRFSPNGKKLRFFEFKLPCMNSKNKFTINW